MHGVALPHARGHQVRGLFPPSHLVLNTAGLLHARGIHLSGRVDGGELPGVAPVCGGGAGPAGGGSPSGRVLRQRVPAAVAGHPRHHHDRELLRHLPKALERGAAGRRGGQSSGAQGDQLLHQRDSVGVAVKRRVYLCLLIILLCSVCCSVYFRLKIFALLIKVEIKP